MRAVFADSGYWVALLNRRDNLHDQADRFSEELGEARIVTSEPVLTEVLNRVSAGPSTLRHAASILVKSLYDSAGHEVIPQPSRQFREALHLYHQRLDKEWSLTDCSSMLIMRAEGIQEVLTYDKHFTQAGFSPLLRPS